MSVAFTAFVLTFIIGSMLSFLFHLSRPKAQRRFNVLVGLIISALVATYVFSSSEI
ncbi:MAG TPA: hypothetical protein VNM92_03945 [Thermoanaerobaculia bacterium]|nr:hypothetical protein [Thermoanaerobaculia bacterium]